MLTICFANLGEKIQEDVYELKNGLTNFAREQLKVSKKIIKYINPKIIIVINALAFDIIRKEFKINEFDDNIGAYTFDINDCKVPIIFSSMLTGQRALDKGSYERLKWHCKMIINSKI